ncbi:hypothetical protein K505DRAFT_299062 [Melanomma pulvis-pyrius CBS 109.77]|uniref:C2H2-type domain-containing protein n=1 Tax=Melanomma pulvis-pyrius CBS 109.77 TaxID=1314802 RepID=A0A6A6XMD3_9PLEO|nr:hypothetical protein K505DRAFT_299062 [Melanomma pulvis-pyrius CBS 109.77]
MQYPHSSSSLKCFCGQEYYRAVDLEEHRTARGHFPSHRCGKHCEHPGLALNKSYASACGDCGKICENEKILNDHHIATGHCFCSECDLHFQFQTTFTLHRENEMHASEFKCCDCNIFFKDVHALTAHMTRRVHRKPKNETSVLAMGHVCSKCQRTFKSTESLEQHRQSVKHKPLSALSCPLGKGCRGNFTSPSALLHHLESGNCKSGMDRDKIYRIVQSCDEDGNILSRTALTPSISPIHPANSSSLCSETWMVSSDTQSEWSLLTPSLSEGSVGDSLEQWLMLEGGQTLFEERRSIDASFTPTLQCPICPKKKKRFATMLALQQHMNSPVHSAKIYHCPSNVFFASSSKTGEKKSREKHFSTLSGLSQHLESGACRGGKRAFLHCIDLIQGSLQRLGLGDMGVLSLNSHK